MSELHNLDGIKKDERKGSEKESLQVFTPILERILHMTNLMDEVEGEPLPYD